MRATMRVYWLLLQQLTRRSSKLCIIYSQSLETIPAKNQEADGHHLNGEALGPTDLSTVLTHLTLPMLRSTIEV